MISNIFLADIGAWLGCIVPTDKQKIRVSGISTDSREMKPGDLFIALKGPNFDGHEYAEECIKKGAVAVVSDREVGEGYFTFCKESPLNALVVIAKKLREKFKGKVVAVTGSAGKSSTKDMIATLLGEHTIKSPASFNNLLGVSKTICLLKDDTKFLVLEMGMNARGEIKEMVDNFCPEYGAITNIGDAHLGKLGGLENIYLAKKEMFDFLGSSAATKGVACNIDDENVLRAFRANFESKMLPFLTYSNKGNYADVMTNNIHVDPDTAKLKVDVIIEKNKRSFSLPIFGKHHSQNIGASVALVKLMGLSDNEIFSRIQQIKPAYHRGEIFELSQQKVLIDESYNSNPTALSESLNSFAMLNPELRRFLVLGEMRELENFSKEMHEKVGAYWIELAQKKKLSFQLVGVGKDMKYFIDKVTSVFPNSCSSHFLTWQETVPYIEKAIKPSDLILVKGSRGIQLDFVVDKLKKDHSQ